MARDTLYIVIPAYNESENIRFCVDDWYPVVEKIAKRGASDSRLVIINDGSKDDTFEIVQSLAETRPFLVCLTKKNGGHGSAVLHGYRYAIQQKADFIFQTDSDGQTDPNEFEAFWKQRYAYDAIIGKREERGDGRSRKFVEKVVCLLLRIFFGVRLKDANAPFRLMRTKLVATYIDRMPEDYALPNIMFTSYFAYYGEKIRFFPISFKPREKGTNSINIRKIVKIGWKALGDFRRFREDMKKYPRKRRR